MSDTPGFIAEPINISRDAWKFFKDIQKSNSKELSYVRALNDDDDDNNDNDNYKKGLTRKFTSMATNATIFRWKFGDKPHDPIIETTINPYIYKFKKSGTYTVSHQSCYPCTSTGTLICSNGWCTQSITIIVEDHLSSGALMLSTGFFGLLLAAQPNNCCNIRNKCVEKLEQCRDAQHKNVENKNICRSIEKLCNNRLKDCKKKCITTRHQWNDYHKRCHEKDKLDDIVCQIIERRKKYTKDKKDNEKD